MADESQSSISLRHYADVLWRRKLIVIAFVIAVPALVLAFSLQQAKQYDAISRVMVESLTTAFNAAAGQNLGDKAPDDRQVATLAGFVVTPEIARRVNVALGWQAPVEELLAAVKATPDANANVISIVATQPHAAKAAQLADAFAEQFVEWRRETQLKALEDALQAIDQQLAASPPGSATYLDLSTRRSQLSVLRALTTGGVEVGETAQLPSSPARPKPLRNTALAALIGLILGIAVAFLRESLDVRFHSVEEIQKATDLPVLAAIELLPKEYRDATRLIALDNPRGAVAEAFRLIRTNLDFLNFNHDIKSLMVTSPLPGQGKTTTIANLAISLLRADKKVALLEGDLRRPALQRYFNVPNSRGLTTVVSGATDFQDAAHRLAFKDAGPSVTLHDSAIAARAGSSKDAGGTAMALDLLTSGPIPPNPGEIVASSQFRQLVRDAGEGRDYVLVDAPPVFSAGDATTLAGIVDGVIVVLRFSDATHQALIDIEQFLARVPGRSLGLVVTGVPRKSKSSSYRYASQEYGYSE